MSLQDDLNRYAEQRTMRAPTPTEAAALVARATASRSWSRNWLVAGALVPIAVAALALFATRTGLPEIVPSSWEAGPYAVIATPVVETLRLGPGDHDVQGDQLEVAASAQVVVRDQGVERTVQLLAGQVTVEARKRTGDGHLTVTADDWQVRVVGTRFSVSHAPFEVAVVEGIVDVIGSDGTWRLRAGDRFESGRVLRAPTTPIPTEPKVEQLATIRKSLLSGDAEAARSALDARLAADPSDVSSWTLLAQLETRERKLERAVAAWVEVTRRGTPAAAQRARFEAARISTDPRQVVELLEAFIATPDPLEPEALLLLGQSYDALGRADDARAVFRRLQADHPGSDAARSAPEPAP